MYSLIQKKYEGKTGSGTYTIDNPYFINTYGEITHEGFKKCFKGITTKNKVFYDLGSGIGKLVVYAGLEKKFKKSIGVELNSNRHKIAKQTLKQIKKEITQKGTSKNIEKANTISFINDSLFNKKYFKGDVYFISNLCFTEEMNKKLGHYFETYNTTKGTIILSSRELPMKTRIKSVTNINCPMTWSETSAVYKYVLN
jgi:hypothetical protein